MQRVVTIFYAAMLTLWVGGCRSLDPGAPPRFAEAHEAAELTSAGAATEMLPVSHAQVADPSRALDSQASTVAGGNSIEQTVGALVASGALAASERQQLVSDLEQTDPVLRAQIVDMLRTARGDNAEPTVVPAVEPRNGMAQTPPREIAPTTQRIEPQWPVERDVTLVDHQAITSQPGAEQTLADRSATTTEPPVVQPAMPAELPLIAAPQALPPPAAPVLDWQSHVNAAIDQLSTQLEASPQDGDDVGRHATLRLLQLAGGSRELAARSIPGIPPAQQDFWSKELFGLGSYLDAERIPNSARRAAEAAVHLRDANARLAEIASLSVRNMTLCSEVKSYGIYTKFEQYEFAPGQEVLVYAEVENFKSVHGAKGFHTALKSSYEILDAAGARVAELEFPLTEEHCQNPRRDYFVRYFVTIPPQIYGGKYVLHLYLTDEHSQKMDHATLDFTVRARAN